MFPDILKEGVAFIFKGFEVLAGTRFSVTSGAPVVLSYIQIWHCNLEFFKSKKKQRSLDIANSSARWFKTGDC
jgi:hypothetical protein